MPDLLDVLREYAEDRMLRGLLDRESEYANVCHCAEMQERELRQRLGAEDLKHLEDLLEERRLMVFFEGNALFRAGFHLAMELARS